MLQHQAGQLGRRPRRIHRPPSWTCPTRRSTNWVGVGAWSMPLSAPQRWTGRGTCTRWPTEFGSQGVSTPGRHHPPTQAGFDTRMAREAAGTETADIDDGPRTFDLF
jgi:hypothetical protein